MKYTVLVNKINMIKNNYLNRINLVTTKNVLDKDILVEEEAYNNYLKLKEFVNNELKIEIGIDTAYRDVKEQEEIYNHYLNVNGEEYCEKYVAVPEFSEHHTAILQSVLDYLY